MVRTISARFQLIAAAGLLVTSGCASSEHFPGEYADAETELEAAEDAGAEEHARELLEAAEESIELAREQERVAKEDRADALVQLEAARKREMRAAQRLDQRRGVLSREREERGLARAEIARIESRSGVLRERGASVGEVEQMAAPQAALAERRLDCTDARIAALEEETRLHELELEDAALEQDAAQARLATAEQRLAFVRALLRRAREEALQAQGESLDAARVDAHSRLTRVRS